MLRLALLAVPALVLLAARPAAACPAPPPGTDYRCSKYDHMMEQLAAANDPAVYVRATRGVLPPRVNGKRALRHLVTSTWIARDPAGLQGQLRILDAADVPDTISTDLRHAIVRSVKWVGSYYTVQIGSSTYALQRCPGDDGRINSCLVRVLPARRVVAGPR